MHYQSLFVPLACESKLHLMSIKSDNCHQKIPVLMIHGMVEDGRIFYHKSGKGFGSYLAKNGYQVYVADLRGIGQSTPKIGKNSSHGQTETIVNDIPALISYVQKHSGCEQIHIIAHSWGGVNVNACLLRFPKISEQVVSAVFFGSKRRIRVKNLERLFKVDFFWNRLGLFIGKHKGFFPAKALKVGSENETNKTHRQCVNWVKHNTWVDSDDGFNYGVATHNANLPATFYIAAINDHSLGHQSDVKLFMQESAGKHSHYQLLAKQNGNKCDYGHLDMLTAPEAIHDHFPHVLKWMHQQQGRIAS